MFSTKKATARANTNIALSKYWGKRNEELMLPLNSSISMTLDKLYTETTVKFDSSLSEYQVVLDNKTATNQELSKIILHLERIQAYFGLEPQKAKVISKNNFPKKAGLASSASGFAALTAATTSALGFNELKLEEISKLARFGSGSATRSVYGGYVEWQAGIAKDGSDSVAKQIVPYDYWPELRMMVTIIDSRTKRIGSRKGMKATVETSPMYSTWLDTVEHDLETIRNAIYNRNFNSLGGTMEKNALKMHATMLTTTPILLYWQPTTIKVMKLVTGLREMGISAYFTIDAGPQVKILTLNKFVDTIKKSIMKQANVERIQVCKAGRGVQLLNEHLF